MAKTRSAYPIILALKVVVAVVVGAAGAALFLLVPCHLLVPSDNTAEPSLLPFWCGAPRHVHSTLSN